jgi:hypothetical protein
MSLALSRSLRRRVFIEEKKGNADAHREARGGRQRAREEDALAALGKGYGLGLQVAGLGDYKEEERCMMDVSSIRWVYVAPLGSLPYRGGRRPREYIER